jgi:exonuclease SbcC
MFDFLFKRRRAENTSTKQADEAQAAATAATAERAKNRQQEREQAMQQAAALADESSALAFVVQCEFADARLQAAQWLQSAEALTEALRAVRNSDRRVAKLLQTRLTSLQHLQRAQAQMQAVLEQAEALLREPAPTPDRAADLDRAWSAATGSVSTPAGDALATQFAALHDALSQRLSMQAQLQRSLVDTRLQLQKLQETLQAKAFQSAGETDPELDAVPAELDRLQQQIAQDREAPEAAALPKQLLPDCEHLLDACRSMHTQIAAKQAADAAARSQHLESVPEHPAQAEPAATNESNTAVTPQAQSGSDSQSDSQSDLQSQSQTQQQSSKSGRPSKPAASASSPAGPEQLSQWLDLLAQLEASLEQGALQAASEAERALRAYDVRALKPAAEAVSRLSAAYAALHHLQGWARWGGNISREELLQAALALPGQTLPVPELVQKIGGLRARWKLLSVSAGPAPQALWEQFDTACTTAYAPAAAQFEQQDKERQENRVAAEALIAEVAQFVQEQREMIATLTTLATFAAADVSDPAAEHAAQPAWKQIAQFEARVRQAWQRLGPLGHKEKRTLERAFNAALKAVQAPLRSRQKIEIAAREAMIAEVAALTADDRQALDTLRRVQAEWQQRAQGVPLARKDEQALWQSFRAACDAVFAQRKEAALTQDAQRQTHLQAKEDVCAQLEQAVADAGAGIDTGPDNPAIDANIQMQAEEALRQAKAAWSRIGPVPRAEEKAIEKRYRDATAALQSLLQTAQDNAAAAARAAEAAQIDDRLAMCFALDAVLTQGALTAEDADAWRARWQAVPHLTPATRALEQVLTQRFEAALAGVAGAAPGEAYLQHLQQQRPCFDDTLLEVEIALGLDSPPELSRQRMQLQVALLQSSMKAGAPVLSGRQQLARLCALPALADQATLTRFGNVVRQALRH